MGGEKKKGGTNFIPQRSYFEHIYRYPQIICSLKIDVLIGGRNYLPESSARSIPTWVRQKREKEVV